MMKRVLALAMLLTACPAGAMVVIDPVPPVSTGIRVGLSVLARMPSSGDAAVDGYRTRLQSLRTVPGDRDRVFLNDTRGTISVMPGGGGTPQTWFDIRQAVPGFSTGNNPGQMGLISFAFHPNFSGDPGRPGYGIFYTVDTSATTGTATLRGKGWGYDHDNIVHEFRVADPRTAVATIVDQREVLRVSQPFSDHGPGTIAFNPLATPGSSDYGKLYIGFGDGGFGGDPFDNAQDLASPLGKILRIDPARGPEGEAYTIPADNPYARTGGVLEEVWASGLRNPQQFSWDTTSGRMLITDIGQSQLEEVNVGTPAGNYGWPAREGTFARGGFGDPRVYDDPKTNPAFIDPIAQFDHEEIARSGFGGAAISGAFAYAGTAMPELYGMTLLSELVSGRMFYFDPASATATQTAPLRELFFSLDGVGDVTLAQLDGNPYGAGRVDLRMGRDETGELFLLTKGAGNIYRLGALTAVPEPGTWMLLILGVAIAGGALRHDRARRLVQSAAM